MSMAVEQPELKACVETACLGGSSDDEASLLPPPMGVCFAFMGAQSDILAQQT